MPVNPAIFAKAGPSLILNFLSGALDPRLTFTRASTAWAFDATGTLRSSTTDTPRFDYGISPGGATNFIRNNSTVGAVIGTPGTVPTNWGGTYINAGSTQITSVAAVNGIPAFRTVLGGSPTNAAVLFSFDTVAQGPTFVGQVWTASCYAQLNSGSLVTGFNSFDLVLREYDDTSTFLRQTSATITTATSTMARFSVTATMGASTAFVQAGIRTFATGAAVAADLTLGSPQMEIGASVSPLIATTSAAVNVGAIPLGLQFEEARTNSLRNNSNTGAAVGAPGTFPSSGWSQNNTTGLTANVVALGTEFGIPWIDIQVTGTTATGTTNNIIMEATTQIAALQNQVWTGSFYTKLVAGSLTNIASTVLHVQMLDSGGASLGTLTKTFTPTAASLASQRVVNNATLTNASTAFVRPFIAITSATAPVAVNLTIRIGAACLELGSFVTSPILTTSAAVTRAVDNASMPLGSWFNPAGFSALCVGMVPVLNGVSNEIPYEFDDGATARAMLYIAGGAVGLFNSVGALNFTVLGANIVANTVYKLAGGFGSTRQGGSGNGGAVTAGSSTLATVTTLRFGSNQGSPTAQRYTGYVQSLTVWPRVLSDSELQKASTR